MAPGERVSLAIDSPALPNSALSNSLPNSRTSLRRQCLLSPSEPCPRSRLCDTETIRSPINGGLSCAWLLAAEPWQKWNPFLGPKGLLGGDSAWTRGRAEGYPFRVRAPPFRWVSPSASRASRTGMRYLRVVPKASLRSAICSSPFLRQLLMTSWRMRSMQSTSR